MFTDTIINESCFFEKLENIAYADFNNTCYECREYFIELVEYLANNNIVQCSDCGYFFNLDEEGVYDESEEGYFCDDCTPTTNHITRYHDYHIVNNSQTSDTFGIELEVEFPNHESADACAEEVYNELETKMSQNSSSKKKILDYRLFECSYHEEIDKFIACAEEEKIRFKKIVKSLTKLNYTDAIKFAKENKENYSILYELHYTNHNTGILCHIKGIREKYLEIVEILRKKAKEIFESLVTE